MSAKNHPSDSSLPRRDFLKFTGLAALAGTGLGLPEEAPATDFEFRHHWPDRLLWKMVRRAFVLERDTVYMNIGTTGSMPRPVLAAYARYNRLVAADPWDMGGEWGPWPYMSGLVETVAPQFGADAHELVLTRNTTDGMCTVLGGLNLQPGDEILTTHHEHVAALSPLAVLAQRQGVTVRQLEIPVFPDSEDEYVDVFRNAVSPATRLIVFSHITYKTGAMLPAQRICQEVAIPNGIPTLIDGAHTVGMVDLDFHAIDCDFYAGSGHKWQCGPGATGILYVRDNMTRLQDFWPDRDPPFFAINSSLYPYRRFFGWQTVLQYVGHDNYPAKRALVDACRMWEAIGRARIERRVQSLSALCKEAIRDTFGAQATLFSPELPGTTSGLTAFNPFSDLTDGTTLTTFRDRLREEYGYIIRTTDFHVALADPEVHALRISTHLFHDEDDVLGLVEAMWDLFQDMR